MKDGLYAKICLYWQKPGQKSPILKNVSVGGKLQSDVQDTSKSVYNPGPRYYFEPVVKDAVVQISDVSTEKTYKMTKFGSPLSSIQIISKSNTFYTVTEDDAPDGYVPPEPDQSTLDDFQPGIWYGRPVQLKEYVDENHLPCFVEFSDAGCTPCKEFRTYVYNNPEFQKWVAESKYYYCRIETQSHDEYSDVTTNAYFLYNIWAKRTTMTIPIFIYYWNKPDGTVVWNLSSYHDEKMTYEELEQSIDDNFRGYQPSPTR